MTDDVLDPWIAAYREENPGAALDAAAIRHRVLVGVGARQRRRLKALRFVFPVAATFFGSVALAASQGMLPRFDDVREWLGVGTTEDAPRTPNRRRAGRVPSSQRAHSPPVAPPVAVETPRRALEAPVESSSLDDLPVREPVRAPPLRPDPLSNELRAYQSAHRLHFDGGDPARALAAWDEYLGAHPAGTFAPEARFNRAVCLLRLGRRAEARSVLAPIAEGSSFAYGRDRARALLEAMGE